jgi:hypothetical protein
MKENMWWRESKSAGLSMSALKWLKPALPQVLGRYLP